jgi:hypothetical protein
MRMLILENVLRWATRHFGLIVKAEPQFQISLG